VHLKDTYWPSQERTAKEKHLTIPRIRAAQLRAAPRSARIARCGRRGIVCARIAARAGKKPDASEGTSASPSRSRRDGRTDPFERQRLPFGALADQSTVITRILFACKQSAQHPKGDRSRDEIVYGAVEFAVAASRDRLRSPVASLSLRCSDDKAVGRSAESRSSREDAIGIGKRTARTYVMKGKIISISILAIESGKMRSMNRASQP